MAKKHNIIHIICAFIVANVLLYFICSNFAMNDVNRYGAQDEQFTIGRIYQMQQNGIISSDNIAGFTGLYEGYEQTGTLYLQDISLLDYTFVPNTSQTGINASALGALNLVLCLFEIAPQTRLQIISFFNLYMFMIVLFIMCYVFYKNFGFFTALYSFVSTVILTYVFPAMLNINYMLWVQVLPIAISVLIFLLWFKIDDAKKDKNGQIQLNLRYYIMLCISLFIAFICDLSGIIFLYFAIMLPFCFIALKTIYIKNESNYDIKCFNTMAIKLSISYLVALLFALIVLFFQHIIYFKNALIAIQNFYHAVILNLVGNAHSFDLNLINSISIEIIIFLYFVFCVFGALLLKAKKLEKSIRYHIITSVLLLINMMIPCVFLMLISGNFKALTDYLRIYFCVINMPFVFAHIGFFAKNIYEYLNVNAINENENKFFVKN